MSLEQWGILALVILVPLLEGVARLRRTPTSHPQNGERLGDHVVDAESRPGAPLPKRHVGDDELHAADQTAIPTGPSPPPLPQRASTSVVSLARLAATRATSSEEGPGSRSREAHGHVQKPLRGDPVVQWLRPVRNLRRAIVLATILGPPSQ